MWDGRPRRRVRPGYDPSMLAVLRRQCILDELQRNGSALISGLAEQLSVSEMTIRRDLAGLEREGRLERVHGGAVLAQRGVEEPGFDKKVLCQQAEKAAIAGLAASMVKPGSAIGLSPARPPACWPASCPRWPGSRWSPTR